MSREKKYITTSTQVTLEVDEILDNLNRVDYDYLIEGLIARNIIEPNEKYSLRVREVSLGEAEYIKAICKLKDKYYLLDTDFINLIKDLARKF